MKAGHVCLLANGETAAIQKVTVEHLDEPQTTYNLEVEGAHTYCVGKDGILVHNACPKINGQDVYRGHPKNPKPGQGIFEATADDYILQDGLVQTTEGVSVHTKAGALKRFGKIYVIDDLPTGLTYRFDTLGYNQIIPKTPMPLNEYQRLLGLIKFTPIN